MQYFEFLEVFYKLSGDFILNHLKIKMRGCQYERIGRLCESVTRT